LDDSGTGPAIRRPGGFGRMPAEASHHAHPPGGRHSRSGSAKKRTPTRFLIADDEHLMATGLANAVEQLGYDVIGPCANGREAVEVARTQLPDMCLLDVRMPEMDGLTAAQHIWDELMIPSIIITAFSDKEYLKRAQEIGVYGYLLKPINSDNLRVTISIGWALFTDHEAQVSRIRQLTDSLEQRRTVETAKWKLVEAMGLTEAEAHQSLQRAARDKRRKLVEVAQDVIDGRDTL
jgi:two-component system, response regulator PdtaR